MGKALAERFPGARHLFNQADDILGRSLSRVCFEGSEDDLRRTANTQPALYVAGAAALAAFRAAGFEAGHAAGHSLGEYTALYAAGSFDFATGLRLVSERAEAMEEAGQRRPGAMAAILGAPAEALIEICAAVSREVGAVTPANWNSPEQTVISGEPAAVERAIERLKSAGAKRALPLNVGGAFHSPLMADARERLAAALAGAKISAPRMTFASNVTGQPESDPERIRALLADQMTSGVRWMDCVGSLARAGAVMFVELGPGKALAGLLKRIDKGATAFNLGHPDQLASLEPLRDA